MGDIEAFEEAFMIAVKDLDRLVKRYLGSGRPVFRWPIDKLVPDFEPDVVTLSREQISLALGQTALRRGELDSAKRWFTIATTDAITRPQAEAGLGDVLKFGSDFEAALPHFEQAVALAPNDPYCQLDLAEYWHDRARNSDDIVNRATYLARAREYYVKAWKLDDSMPETYAMYAGTFLMENRRYDFAIELLEQAQDILPSSIALRGMLAEAYMGAWRIEDAVAAARSVLAWSHDESGAAKWAREILETLTGKLPSSTSFDNCRAGCAALEALEVPSCLSQRIVRRKLDAAFDPGFNAIEGPQEGCGCLTASIADNGGLENIQIIFSTSIEGARTLADALEGLDSFATISPEVSCIVGMPVTFFFHQ